MAATREIRFPADAILTLRRTLVRELGAQAAGRALQEAGNAVGDTLHDRLARLGSDDNAIEDTPSASFWDRLAGLFREMGWGTLQYQDLHPGVGALDARDWFEADPGARRPSCPFTTGVLANILGRIAGGEVAVLQVPLPDGAAGGSRFLFGGSEALQRLYGGLREGRDLDAALGSLG
jgi:hypothetical protein